MENVLGILGGMGPQATQLFYKMLIEHTEASKDQDHINVLIFGHATMPDRTEAILFGDTEGVAEKLRDDLAALAAFGCQAVAVPCNTAHYFIDNTDIMPAVPVVHMIKESAKEAAKTSFGQKVGILATDGTIKTRLYQEALDAEGVLAYVVSDRCQRLVMYEIYDCVKSGKPADKSAWREIERELKDAGCKRAILACTELSVVRDELSLPDYYIDAMEVMALRAIEIMGKRIKENV